MPPYLPIGSTPDPLPKPRDPGPAAGTRPKLKHHDPHMLCIDVMVQLWKRDEITADQAIRAIKAYVLDRDSEPPVVTETPA